MRTKQPEKTMVDAAPERARSGGSSRLLFCACSYILVSAALMTSGCQSCANTLRYNDTCDRFLSQRIACFEARAAWWSYKSRCGSRDCLGDAKRGFIQGYSNCAMGGDCRPPIVPERRYWSTWYQSGYGQQRINAWYEGFPLGVAAARTKGHGYELRTPVTEEVSAYFAATSPTAMREASRNPTTPAYEVQGPAPVPADPFRSAATPELSSSSDAERQPMLSEYLDLPSDTSVMPEIQPADPFVQSDQQLATPFDSEVDIVPSGRRTNDMAGDFPAELLPGRN